MNLYASDSYSNKINIMHMLYNPPRDYLQKELVDIVRENNYIHKGDDNLYGIMYENVTHYTNQFSLKKGKVYPCADSLKERMHDWKAFFKEIEQEKHLVDRVVTIGVSCFKHEDDLKEVFGDVLCNNLYYSPTATKVDTSTFIAEHKPVLELMHQRFFKNILMRDIYAKNKHTI